MKRPDWRDHLHTYLERCEGRPFSWTHHSCLTFAVGAVVAITGIDYWQTERSDIERLHARADVLKYMTRYGGTLIGATDRAMRRAQAQRRVIPGAGDILIAHVDKKDTAGVCLGRLSAFVGPDGLMYLKPDDIRAAWGVS